MEIKRYLMQRADPTGTERTVKQQVRDILKGLLPQVRNFCEKKLKDPFSTTTAKSTLETFEGLEKLLRWAEGCMYEDRKVLAINSTTELEASPVMITRRQGSYNNYNGHTSNNRDGHNRSDTTQPNYTEFEKIVLTKLDKFDAI